MDVFQLRLELIDFTSTSKWWWRVRRFLIGWLLWLYYTYSLTFFVLLLYPHQLKEPADTTKAEVPAPDPQQMYIESDDHVLITATFGLIGSIYLITRTFVRTVNKKDLPFSWYLVRPLQGVLMAIFVYFAFRAGELVFFGNRGDLDESAINVWVVAALAILAGAFSEEAYDRLHAMAGSIFKPENNERGDA